MKTKRILLGLAMTVIATLGFAQQADSDFEVQVKGPQTFSVGVEQATEDLEVYFINQQGTVLFEDEVNAGQDFAKTFDMKKLPDGNYQLKVVDEFRIQVVAVALHQGNVKLNLAESRNYYIPELTRSSRQSTVRVNSISMDPTIMVIDNHTGRVIYTGKVEGDKYYFNLAEVEDNTKYVISADGFITSEGLGLTDIASK